MMVPYMADPKAGVGLGIVALLLAIAGVVLGALAYAKYEDMHKKTKAVTAAMVGGELPDRGFVPPLTKFQINEIMGGEVVTKDPTTGMITLDEKVGLSANGPYLILHQLDKGKDTGLYSIMRPGDPQFVPTKK